MILFSRGILPLLLLILGCSHTTKEIHHPGHIGCCAPQKDQFTFDFDHFFGERVILSQQYPSQINQLHVNLIFPQNYEFLPESHSRIRLFTKNKLIKEFFITETNNSLTINEKINDEQLFVELGLMYCRSGDQGLCLMKNVLYEINLDSTLPGADLDLTYNIPEDK